MLSDERREEDGKTLTLSLKSPRPCQEKTPDPFSVPKPDPKLSNGVRLSHASGVTTGDAALLQAVPLTQERTGVGYALLTGAFEMGDPFSLTSGR